MNELLREKLIRQRYEDLLKDSDRIAEVIADYSDVIAAKCVKCKWNRNKVGNDITDYLGLHLYDIAEMEIDYENQSKTIDEAFSKMKEEA